MVYYLAVKRGTVTMSHELTPSNGQERRAFGDNGPDIGIWAGYLLKSLHGAQAEAAQDASEKEWLEEDSQSLDELVELEWYIPFLDPSAESELAVIRMNGIISNFHSALPFTEAERQWLVSCYRKSTPEDKDNSRRSYLKMALMDRGIYQIVEERDIMRRWHSWRRQTDEFEGHPGIHIAGNELRYMAQLANVDVPFPGDTAQAA
jgi:hypothetical protein